MKKYLSSILGVYFIIISISIGQNPYIVVLGIAQDGGYPQAECKKSCCQAVWKNPKLSKMVSSIAVVDPGSKSYWIIDATPDLPAQLQLLHTMVPLYTLAGVLLTHAHVGHYTGIMHFGREVIGARDIPLYVMPRMKNYLSENGPWSQLIELNNIALKELAQEKIVMLNERIQIKPFTVPHRDEFSETVGFQILFSDKKIVFIPDIDKWQKWSQSIKDIVFENDILLLDGTFYREGEINRPMSEVPHPFITETMSLLTKLDKKTKSKIYFIHLNHTNPLLQKKSKEYRETTKQGFGIASEGQVFK